MSLSDTDSWQVSAQSGRKHKAGESKIELHSFVQFILRGTGALSLGHHPRMTYPYKRVPELILGGLPVSSTCTNQGVLSNPVGIGSHDRLDGLTR